MGMCTGQSRTVAASIFKFERLRILIIRHDGRLETRADFVAAPRDRQSRFQSVYPLVFENGKASPACRGTDVLGRQFLTMSTSFHFARGSVGGSERHCFDN